MKIRLFHPRTLEVGGDCSPLKIQKLDTLVTEVTEVTELTEVTMRLLPLGTKRLLTAVPCIRKWFLTRLVVVRDAE